MGPKVTVCYVHPNEVSASFHACLQGMLMYDAGRGQHLTHSDGQLASRCGTDGLVDARNQVVNTFLTTSSEWLLWVDADMGFEPNALEMLLSCAHPTDRPVVGGLAFASFEKQADGMGGFRTTPRPTLYLREEVFGEWHYVGASFYAVNDLIRCDATGSAFVLIHRSVFLKMRDEFGTFYDRLQGPKGKLGEDISFCERLRQLEIPLFVHTGIRTTHHKPQWVCEADFWRDYVAPPATEEVAVIVPVMRRPFSARPFMESLRASTGLAKAYAICDEDDPETRLAWERAGAEVVPSSGSRFAVKVNDGYRATSEPYLLFVGDDVRFHPGWWDQALHVSKTLDRAVVATNDLGNSAVMAGLHASHPVMRRDYIDEFGASWDGPGKVAHEAYKHWYVDNEWTLVARQRGQFAAALGSKVEHLHPIFGKGKEDAVYKKGQATTEQDQRLFIKRFKENASAA